MEGTFFFMLIVSVSVELAAGKCGGLLTSSNQVRVQNLPANEICVWYAKADATKSITIEIAGNQLSHSDETFTINSIQPDATMRNRYTSSGPNIAAESYYDEPVVMWLTSGANPLTSFTFNFSPNKQASAAPTCGYRLAQHGVGIEKSGANKWCILLLDATPGSNLTCYNFKMNAADYIGVASLTAQQSTITKLTATTTIPSYDYRTVAPITAVLWHSNYAGGYLRFSFIVENNTGFIGTQAHVWLISGFALLSIWSTRNFI